MKTRSIIISTFSVLVCLLTGGISGWLSVNGMADWYSSLVKPFFNPPGYLFGPVWTILYMLMGISFSIVALSAFSTLKRLSVFLFCIQLLLNFLWSILFFRFHSPLLALFDIILLWIFILLMIIFFYKVKPIAAWLQLPYLIWVTFAAILNYSIWMLNR